MKITKLGYILRRVSIIRLMRASEPTSCSREFGHELILLTRVDSDAGVFTAAGMELQQSCQIKLWLPENLCLANEHILHRVGASRLLLDVASDTPGHQALADFL